MYILIFLVMLILPIWAQINVTSTFKKFSSVSNSRGLTGAQVARQILDNNGLYNIRVEHISGNLTDHFDPSDGVVRLSDATYNSTSVSAIGVAAHECGHACQHAEEYKPIQVRTAIVPYVNICSKLWYWVFLAGVLLIEMVPELVYIGIIMFSAVVLFQLVTLPVELDASGRALKTLENDMILDYNEIPMARKVLRAAAMTYVTALVVSLMQLLRLILSTRRR
ncbi:MAG: zinc metallopeptidase [Ruminococcus sp.]|jgi:hypothetical protein|nr:zinc metallopeptidase [Ruminococcus sp.]